MEGIYTEVGLVHADEDGAPTRLEPRTLDEVLGHPTRATSPEEDDRTTSPSSIDREIFGFLVSP